MATKYLDNTGLAYFWGKIKSWVTNRGYITSSGSITGNAATATRLAGPKHNYTTAANQAKAWLRIANANTSQIDPDTPLHLQFFVRAQAQAAGVAYWQSWFVDLEVWGTQSGLRIFGNGSTSPFSQARVLYENTVASVTSSTRPAVDIYLNYVLAAGSVVEVEEVYNSGFDFVADGVLAVSTVPSGYENRAVSPYGGGVQYSQYADRSSLPHTAISANTTLNTSSHTRLSLDCTGTITLTLPSVNSSTLWYFVKNYGTGVVTLHPASASVYIDNVSADITLQPGEFIQLACQSNAHYSIVSDGRWMSQKADSTHVHGSITNDGKLGTASRVVVTDGNKAIGVSSITTTKLGYLTDVTANIQGQINGKADDSGVVHLAGNESISGRKTFANNAIFQGGLYGISKDNSEEDANDLYITAGGAHQKYYTTANGKTKLSNIPAAVNTTLESYTVRYISASDWVVHQILHNNNALYYRAGSSTNGGTWSDWRAFAFTDSNITGNAATASSVPWSGVTGKPSTITTAQINALFS